jgi:hypothetical protein
MTSHENMIDSNNNILNEKDQNDYEFENQNDEYIDDKLPDTKAAHNLMKCT